MTQRFLVIIAVLVLAICLISGGCGSNSEQPIKSWRDLVNLLPEPQQESQEEPLDMLPTVEPLPEAEPDQETIEVVLYFGRGMVFHWWKKCAAYQRKKALPAALLMN